MDKCDEGLAVPVVRVGRECWPAFLLHVKGENDTRCPEGLRETTRGCHRHR